MSADRAQRLHALRTICTRGKALVVAFRAEESRSSAAATRYASGSAFALQEFHGNSHSADICIARSPRAGRL